MIKAYEHIHFKAEYAVLYGIPAAILLSHIEYIVKLNNQDYLYDNRFWYRLSIPTIREKFPFLPERTIKRALAELCEKGALLKGNYNKVHFDRTNWYSLPSYTFGPIDHTLLAPSSSTDLAPSEDTLLAPSSIYKEINKEVVEVETTTPTKPNNLKNKEKNHVERFEKQFDEEYQKINNFISLHKLKSLKIHISKLFDHFSDYDSFIDEINNISEWNGFPKDEVFDEDQNRTFTKEQKRIVIVSLLKSIGVLDYKKKS